MSEPSSSDSSEEEMEARRPGESDITVESSARKYMKTSEGLPVAVTTLDPSLVDLAPELRDVIPACTSQNVVQQNLIHMNVQQNVTMKGSANMTLGGTQNVSTSPPAYESLLQRTIKKLDKWTKGIVETASLKKVMDKINKGISWVTIKGCPGEGKTTTAHMALKELHKAGRKIFDLATPEEFSTVVTSCLEHPVIMLDDVFGNLEFDKTEWSKWKPILLKTLADHQYNSEDDGELPDEESSDEKNHVRKPDVTVILVGRQYVLNVCVSDLGKVADFFTQEKHVVNLSNPDQRDYEEKMSIWRAISASSQIELDKDTIEKICKLRIAHGFPHVCKLFVTLRKQQPDLSPLVFFEKPLEFLNQTIQQFIRNSEKCNLFKEMLNHGGKLSSHEMEEFDDKNMVHVATDLLGTYLRKEDDYFRFDHPSVYDSVAYNMCNVATSFVIKHCEMDFIHERIRLRKENDSETVSHLVVRISRDYIPELAERFAREISDGIFSHSLCHQAFTDAEFVAKTMSLVTVDLQKLLKMQDNTVRQSFYTLLSSNGSPELLKYVEKKHNVSIGEIEEIFHGVCMFAATEVLCYMEQKKLLNVNSVRHLGQHEIAAMSAAKGRNKAFVGKLMFFNPDLHYRDYMCRTLLHLLVENGLEEAVEQAIEKGADVNCKDQDRSTPLIYACRGGHENIVQILIKRGAYVNCKDKTGLAPLLYACRENNGNIVKMLIENGAWVDIKDRSGNTPLKSACQDDYETIVQILIENGAMVDLKDKQGYTALLHACKHNHENIVKILIENGADVNIGVYGSTPLLHACRLNNKRNVKNLINAGVNIQENEFAAACFTGNLQLVELLVSKTSRTPTTHAVLTAAVKSGNVKMLELLIKQGVSVKDQNEEPLHTACMSGFTEIARVLLENGALVNAKDFSGNTSLHLASTGACFNLLLRFNPDLNAKTNEGFTVTHAAASKGFTEGICALIQARIDIDVPNSIKATPLFYASEVGSSECVRLLIEAGADVNRRSLNEDTPLLVGKSEECVSLLIKAGADVNAVNHQNRSLLHVILSAINVPDQEEIAAILIKNKADVNLRDEVDYTPLHYAACRHQWPIIPLLLQAGANPKLTNMEGQTPLHLALPIQYGNTHTPLYSHTPLAVIKELIGHGANVNSQDRNANTPLHFLYSNIDGHKEIIQLLITSGADVNIMNERQVPALAPPN